MKSEDMTKIFAGAALLVAVIAIVLVFANAPVQQPAGITYDPNKQPSILPLKELTAQTDQVSGIIIDHQKINTTAGTGSPYIGQVVMWDGSTWIKADATTAMTGKIGIVAKAPTTNVSADGQILMQGVVRNSSWTLTKGTIYYANATVPGSFSKVKPADGTTMIQPIGWGYNTTVLYFDPVVNVTANGM
jgi:hypothetical protein